MLDEICSIVRGNPLPSGCLVAVPVAKTPSKVGLLVPVFRLPVAFACGCCVRPFAWSVAFRMLRISSWDSAASIAMFFWYCNVHNRIFMTPSLWLATPTALPRHATPRHATCHQMAPVATPVACPSSIHILIAAPIACHQKLQILSAGCVRGMRIVWICMRSWISHDGNGRISIDYTRLWPLDGTLHIQPAHIQLKCMC